MLDQIQATPFGRRTLSLVSKSMEKAVGNGSVDVTVERWRLMRDCVAARAKLNLSHGALVVLEALLSCLPHTVMSAGQDLLVYPSNEQLAQRCKGMDGRSVRRYIASLVEAGLVLRRDSPNGKRFAVRNRAGEVVEAYGFDLNPLLVKAEQISSFAEEAAAEEREVAALRRQVMILRRFIRQALALAAEDQWHGPWNSLDSEFRPLALPLSRRAGARELNELFTRLRQLASMVDKALEANAIVENESANDGVSIHHHLDSNTESQTESEPAYEKAGANVLPLPIGERKPISATLPLALILKACPDIGDYAPAGIRSWRDLIDTAALVRGFLGISPSAWEDARRVLGEVDASITVAGLLQRHAEIRSAGGYLRQLTAKAEAGRYSTSPMIIALLKRQTTAA